MCICQTVTAAQPLNVQSPWIALAAVRYAETLIADLHYHVHITFRQNCTMPVSTASMPCHLQIGFGARIKIHLPAYGIHVNYNAAALCSGDHILQQTMNAEAAAAAVEVACYSQTTPEAFDFALIPVLQG